MLKLLARMILVGFLLGSALPVVSSVAFADGGSKPCATC
jgi:hypothetical protein